jgi:hypothetical protein
VSTASDVPREIASSRDHSEEVPMATAKKKKATRRLSTADQNRLPDRDFAFPKERKEPLTDAAHVRNAIARFDQVEGVTDAERDRAWKRILKAAKRFDVEITADSWRQLAKGGKPKKR